MAVVGLIGTGSMGSALGAGWREAGARVLTAGSGRSDRSRRLAQAAGLELVAELDDVIAACEVLASVVPPGAATAVAREVGAAVRRTGARPLVVELNAIAPSTLAEVERALGCDLVDGAISGGPPRSAAEPTRVYLAGPRASEIEAIPNPRMDVVVLDRPVGAASALKMCTASMYKGTKALVMQALITAEVNGVRDAFLADTMREWPNDVPFWPVEVAIAASKAWRFVDEMYEIAATQRDAGLPGELFDGIAAAYERAARTELGRTAPEDVDRGASVTEVIARLRSATG